MAPMEVLFIQLSLTLFGHSDHFKTNQKDGSSTLDTPRAAYFLQSFLLSKARGSTVMQALSTMSKEGAMTKLRSRNQFK